MAQKKNRIWIIALIVALIITGLIITTIQQGQRIRELQWERDKIEHNWNAARDSIRYWQDEQGNWIAQKSLYILTQENLEDALVEYQDHVKELEKRLGEKLDYITELEGQIGLVDTIYMETDTTDHTFRYEDSWIRLAGASWEDRVRLDELYLPVPLTVGVTGSREFLISTPNPYVHFTSIQGAIIDPLVREDKKRRMHERWMIGVMIGPGLYYDFVHEGMGAGIGFQVGVGYRFW